MRRLSWRITVGVCLAAVLLGLCFILAHRGSNIAPTAC
jgi:hypothetical protein